MQNQVFELSSDDFSNDGKIYGNGKRGLLMLYSNNCGYCHEVMPVIEEFAKRSNYYVAKLSVNDNPVVANYIFSKYKTNGVPSFFQIKGSNIFAPNRPVARNIQGLTNLVLQM